MVQGLVAFGPEDVREVGRLNAAEHHIGVGEGQRASRAVAGGAGVRSGRVGSYPVADAVEVQDGPAAGRDGVDVQHRRLDPDSRHVGGGHPLVPAGEMGHVGGGAAHVETDDLREARQL